MHSYNAILSLDSLLTADSQDTIYAGLSQALDYTGLSALSYMSSQYAAAVITKMSTCGSDYKIATTAVKPMEQMRGHNDHAAFLTSRNIMLYPEYKEKINEYRKGLHKADTSTENIEEDKKREDRVDSQSTFANFWHTGFWDLHPADIRPREYSLYRCSTHWKHRCTKSNSQQSC